MTACLLALLQAHGRVGIVSLKLCDFRVAFFSNRVIIEKKMNDLGGELFASGQPTSPSPVVKDLPARPLGETLKMMNPTPNGYSSVSNHKPDDPEKIDVKKHTSDHHHKHSNSTKHNADHADKREDKSSKHKSSSSHSKPKDSSSSKDGTDKNATKSKEHRHDKEKKHHSSHKDGSKSKDGKSSQHSSLKKEEKTKSDIDKDKSPEKPKSDNFKENEKVKDGKVKESKDVVKEKHKEKHKEGKDKTSEKVRDKSSEKHKDKHSSKSSDKKHEIKTEKVKHSEKSMKKPSDPTKHSSDKMRESALSSKKVKDEPVSEDDVPLAARKPAKLSKAIKRDEAESDDEPARKKSVKTKKRKVDSDDEDSDYKKPVKKKVKKENATQKRKTDEVQTSPKKKGKKEEEVEVWKWWEEEKHEGGAKWKTLEHNGPVFAPPYERVPKNVKFYYDGKAMELSDVTEEVAGFYGRMLDHEYTSKDSFNTNFFKDWRKVMTSKEKEIIKDLSKCNFKEFDIYYKRKSEERKSMTKEEKLEIKKQNEELTQKYGFCIIDGHKQKIGNFRIEPPGLFRGRGEHPKMGMLKRRVEAEVISINIGKNAKVPEAPPGHKWKDVRHDNSVTWLASWSENILGSTKYIMLNPSSKLKGEKDFQKYETARKLKNHAERIRKQYTEDFKSKEMKVRQRAVALYFIDRLALRAGNEKDEDTADTVGCCSLRVEHITLDDEKDGKPFVVSFDFLGKDSIRYENSVSVEKKAYKNLKLFMEGKQPGDDLFDRLNTTILNKYLTELMDGLTAKVFRTYNASKTLQEQLDLLTKEDMSLPEKVLAYNRANRSVAVLCNHQRAVPKGFDKSMENLKIKMDEKKKQIKECKKEVKELKQAAKSSSKEKINYEKKKKRLQQLDEQLKKLDVQATDREENKQIALGTSKLNYLDPRISVAWCKKWDVPIEKIYNRTQRDKFLWAIEMAGPDFEF